MWYLIDILNDIMKEYKFYFIVIRMSLHTIKDKMYNDIPTEIEYIMDSLLCLVSSKSLLCNMNLRHICIALF